jgi:hypothetical protein
MEESNMKALKATILTALLLCLLAATQPIQAGFIKWSSLGAGFLAGTYALFKRSSMSGSGLFVATTVGAIAGALAYTLGKAQAAAEHITLGNKYEKFKVALLACSAKDSAQNRSNLIYAIRDITVSLNTDYFRTKRQELLQLAWTAVSLMTRWGLSARNSIAGEITRFIKNITEAAQ